MTRFNCYHYQLATSCVRPSFKICYPERARASGRANLCTQICVCVCCARESKSAHSRVCGINCPHFCDRVAAEWKSAFKKSEARARRDTIELSARKGNEMTRARRACSIECARTNEFARTLFHSPSRFCAFVMCARATIFFASLPFALLRVHTLARREQKQRGKAK